MKHFLALAFIGSTVSFANAADTKPVDFTPQEKQMIIAHGPWPVPTGPDPSNRF